MNKDKKSMKYIFGVKSKDSVKDIPVKGRILDIPKDRLVISCMTEWFHVEIGGLNLKGIGALDIKFDDLREVQEELDELLGKPPGDEKVLLLSEIDSELQEILRLPLSAEVKQKLVNLESKVTSASSVDCGLLL